VESCRFRCDNRTARPRAASQVLPSFRLTRRRPSEKPQTNALCREMRGTPECIERYSVLSRTEKCLLQFTAFSGRFERRPSNICNMASQPRMNCRIASPTAPGRNANRTQGNEAKATLMHRGSAERARRVFKGKMVNRSTGAGCDDFDAHSELAVGGLLCSVEGVGRAPRVLILLGASVAFSMCSEAIAWSAALRSSVTSTAFASVLTLRVT
jgi:hypothetical protein